MFAHVDLPKVIIADPSFIQANILGNIVKSTNRYFPILCAGQKLNPDYLMNALNNTDDLAVVVAGIDSRLSADIPKKSF